MFPKLAKTLYSHFYYTFLFVHFKRIEPSVHYLEHHADEVPYEEAVSVILRTKNPRKKGNKFEIEGDGYYILFEVVNGTAYIINAKRS